MPIQHAIWQVGPQPLPLKNCKLPSEQLLKEMIVSDPRILSSEWLQIGRQEITSFGGRTIYWSSQLRRPHSISATSPEQVHKRRRGTQRLLSLAAGQPNLGEKRVADFRVRWRTRSGLCPPDGLPTQMPRSGGNGVVHP